MQHNDSSPARYYSVDLGLVHFIALDLNMYAYTAEPYAPYPFTAKPQVRSAITALAFGPISFPTSQLSGISLSPSLP